MSEPGILNRRSSIRINKSLFFNFLLYSELLIIEVKFQLTKVKKPRNLLIYLTF